MEESCATDQPMAMPYDGEATILRGVPRVLARLAEIDALRLAVGREKDLSTDLLLILSRHNARQRRPAVVLLRRAGLLRAAVIFAERCVLGFGIGLLRAGDQVGDGAVIAVEEERAQALLAAMEVLLRERRCHTVAATLSGVSSIAVHTETGMLAESECRTVRRFLPLQPTLEETLRTRFTLKKRKNLQYYSRRLSRAHDVEFVPWIPLPEAEGALRQLALHCWPSRTTAEIRYHCEFLGRHSESFCMGLRLREGTWLSLITGWRMDGVTHMPWQLNHESYKDESLMQVMRTSLLAHECGLGQKAVSWVGGTVAFQTACEPEVCVDVLKARRGVRGGVLGKVLVPLLYRRNPGAFRGGSLMLLLGTEERERVQGRGDPES